MDKLDVERLTVGDIVVWDLNPLPPSDETVLHIARRFTDHDGRAWVDFETDKGRRTAVEGMVTMSVARPLFLGIQRLAMLETVLACIDQLPVSENIREVLRGVKDTLGKEGLLGQEDG